jgi:hypothetical protein
MIKRNAAAALQKAASMFPAISVTVSHVLRHWRKMVLCGAEQQNRPGIADLPFF